MEEGYNRATRILEENRESLTRLAEALLEYETLDSCDIEAIIKGQSLKSKTAISSDTDSEGESAREKAPGSSPLPQLINPKGKPAPA